jgi:hypothetical protein
MRCPFGSAEWLFEAAKNIPAISKIINQCPFLLIRYPPLKAVKCEKNILREIVSKAIIKIIS